MERWENVPRVVHFLSRFKLVIEESKRDGVFFRSILRIITSRVVYIPGKPEEEASLKIIRLFQVK